jgi:hypothetical protein
VSRIEYHWLIEVNLAGDDLRGANFKDAKIDKSQLTPEQIAQALWDEEA